MTNPDQNPLFNSEGNEFTDALIEHMEKKEIPQKEGIAVTFKVSIEESNDKVALKKAIIDHIPDEVKKGNFIMTIQCDYDGEDFKYNRKTVLLTFKESPQIKKGLLLTFLSGRKEVIVSASSDRERGHIKTAIQTYSTDYVMRGIENGLIKVSK